MKRDAWIILVAWLIGGLVVAVFLGVRVFWPSSIETIERPAAPLSKTNETDRLSTRDWVRVGRPGEEILAPPVMLLVEDVGGDWTSEDGKIVSITLSSRRDRLPPRYSPGSWKSGGLGFDRKYKGKLELSPRLLQGLHDLPHLRSLQAADTGLDDDGLAVISSLNQLEMLFLRGTRVTDRGLRHVSKMKNLRTLGLPEQIGDDGLAVISSLNQLERLFLRGTRVTDRGLRHVSKMKNLRALGLPKQIGDEGVAHLRSLSALEQLNLQHSHVTDDGIRHIAGLTDLRRLTLYGTKISDSGMDVLRQLVNLQSLTLNGTNVTDASADVYSNLEALESLDIGGTQIGDESLKAIGQLQSLTRLITGPDVTDRGLLCLKDLRQLELFSSTSDRIEGPGLEAFSNHKHLKHLYLWNSTLDDAALKTIATCRDLELLTVYPSTRNPDVPNDSLPPRFTDAGVAELVRLPKLRYLLLASPHITDQAMESIVQIDTLSELSIIAPRVSNEGLAHLDRMSRLEKLTLIATRVTKAAADRFADTNSGCEVRHFERSSHHAHLVPTWASSLTEKSSLPK